MTASNKYWMLITIFLVVAIIIGGIVIWSRYSPSQPIEISLAPAPEIQGRIYIGGAVTNPGLYSFTSQDSLEALIRAAGGSTDSANLSELRLHLPTVGEETEPQKIDLNRAEAWLLKALPGIGETLAQRISDYRQQNGPFRNIRELLKVEGIGEKTYDQIKHLITVVD